MFNSTKLRQVVGVDRAGSFSGASKVLNISQSTLTKAVADVEVVLGFTLFVRTAKGVSATPEGREFLNRAARIVADFEMLIDDAKANRDSSDQNLRVGVSPATLEGLFNRPAAQLLKKRPNISLTLVGVPSDRGVDMLKRGDLDVLYAPLLSLEREVEFAVEPVHTLNMQLFCRRGHPVLENDSLTAEDLREYRFVTSDLFELFGKQIERLFSYENGDLDKNIHMINNFSIITAVVAETDSISVVSSDYAQTGAFQKRFATLEIDFFGPMEFGMARLSKWLPSRSARAFEDAVRKAMGG